MSVFQHYEELITSEATAHLGHALRTGEKEWKVMDHYGNSLATIFSPARAMPQTFRCDPSTNVRYLDAVEAEDFMTLLDYALKNFSLS